MPTSQKQEKKISVGSKLLDEYLDFLNNHRGLGKKTIHRRKNDVLPFLRFLKLQNELEDIGKLSVIQIYDYVIKVAKPMNRYNRKQFVASIRGFLKFAHLKGYVNRDLTEAVPAIRVPKLGNIPHGIPWNSVEKLLAAANRETHTGRRNYAVLQLLATYGVRIGQVAKLRLQDINWREGSIYFQPSKWGNPLHFPLYPEVADALLRYIRETRGKISCPEVFLTVCGKPRPFASGGSLSSSMEVCFRWAGIPHKGIHSIRHAFATRLMEQETPVKTIADLLGHKSVGTTFIYTKVDLKHLRLVACEWPEVLS